MTQKILVVGDLSLFTRSSQRFQAIHNLGQELGYETLSICTKSDSTSNFLDRIRYKLGYPPDKAGINQAILEKVMGEKPSLVWIDKGLVVRKNTLLKIKKDFPHTKLALWSPEYIKPRQNRSRFLMECLSLYDYWFSPMSQNCRCSWLKERKPKNTICVNQGYDKNLHRPLTLSKEEEELFTSDVNFIGTFERPRGKQLLNIAEAGIQVRIWGNGWERWINKHPNLKVENKPLYGEDYIKALCASKINLAFLRKANQDKQTSRTIEIPACGAFMLAERTPELTHLFQEGKEAEFFDFDNTQELIEKITYYLNHETERKEIARLAREKCFKSKYSYEDILRPLLKQCLNNT